MPIHPTAEVADDVVFGGVPDVGPFAVLGLDGPAAPLVIGPGAIIRSHAVIYRGTRIGSGFHAGHGALVREDTQIGNQVSVGSHSIVEHHVEVADGVRMHSGCFVPEFTVLEEGCWLGPGVILTNAKYPNRVDTKESLRGVRVGRGVVIGAGAVILPGVNLDPRAIVGAAAVVVRDVRAGTVVVGNPARELEPPHV